MTREEFLKTLKSNISEKERIEDFLVSATDFDENNIKLLEDNDIHISKASQLIVLQMDNEELKRNIARADELGFIDAYKQNPRNAIRDANVVARRIAESEAHNIPWKNEEGKISQHLFGNRLYNYVLGQTSEEEVTKDVTKDNTEVLELAYRLLEEFALDDKKDEVKAKLDEIKDKGLSTKEMLMEVMKAYGGNLEFLSSKIDELLEYEKSLGMGRVA